jgi:hypothetical protein
MSVRVTNEDSGEYSEACGWSIGIKLLLNIANEALRTPSVKSDVESALQRPSNGCISPLLFRRLKIQEQLSANLNLTPAHGDK